MSEQSRNVCQHGNHALPVKWDGLPIEWKGFELSIPILCRNIPPWICEHCGTKEEPSLNFGTVFNERGKILKNLALYRCMECGYTQVWDMEDETWWELDSSDYSDEGSYEVVS